MTHIVLVEDNQWFAELYRDLLEVRGITVECCGDGYQAIEALDRHRLDAIVLDMWLPWANGLQLLHELASYADLSDIPVVLCSSAPPTLTPEAQQAYGIAAVIDKTVSNPNHFIQTIQAVIGRHANI